MSGPEHGSRVPLDSIDLFDPHRYRTYPQHHDWHTLRAEAPVWRQQRPGQPAFWSVTKYDAVRAMIKDTASFSSTHGNVLDVADGGDSAGGFTMPLMDPPSHGWLRGPSIRTMSTLVVRRREEEIRARLRRMLDPLYQGEIVDVADIMLHLPMLAVGEILGIPESVWPDIPAWTMSGVAPEDPLYSAGTNERTLRKAHYQLFAMFSEVIADRRRSPKDDLISVLVGLDFGGRGLDDHEVLLNCYSMVMGANTTTPYVASHLVLAMSERPDAWAMVRDDPSLASSCVEEALRWATPTNHLMRKATKDVEIDGVHIGEGEIVCAWLASANRDEEVFEAPYEFRPDRQPNPHLAFSIGPHYCIGGPAARAVLNVMVEELAADFEVFEPAGEVRHLASNFINGMTRLPILPRLRRDARLGTAART
ncbi:cytochrome P450 [Sphaerisporangium sp. TRM90804]|uniref:cytochrome P450 n=1 Tax=Sphaerisporangium sp. TRM90804 TaxID=3031113 RepID=UPI00244B9659|nr:cytochrome P450 [Sphaerisporangium sp. TRM90804]MDH2423780.1 cytochrome P450 [Sphaerisporangium sp. TRM90804]